MAWYALYKWFIPWRKTPFINWIDYYNHYLYNEWFNNLSENEQKAELRHKQKLKEREQYEIMMAFNTLRIMYDLTLDIYKF